MQIMGSGSPTGSVSPCRFCFIYEILNYIDPRHKDNDYLSRRNMGFRPTGLSSLTGYVDNSRQSDPSAPVRYLQPPSETLFCLNGDSTKESVTISIYKCLWFEGKIKFGHCSLDSHVSFPE